jgi:DMSO/TMAO reductase YedYZ molybdopterin-dependent catalytic subunit
MKKDPNLPERQMSSRQIVIRTALSFIFFLVVGMLAWTAFNHVKYGARVDDSPKALRKVLVLNEQVFSSLFRRNHLVKEYPVSAAVKKVRVNGDEGLSDDVDEETWRLRVAKSNGDTMLLTLDDIKRLPKKDIVFDFKCIEGWSQVTHWAGVPFKTFMQAYGLDKEAKMNYVGLQTPDKGYYVGVDMPSALQQQTLLCYEMNGAPLPVDQGFPLRLIIPVKYGIKHLKRIGTIFFSNTKPADYWAQRGYDYYAGH